ncbi:glycosyltransferase family 4 protein [Adlercreutzia sp. R25]|uniref:glycosyltransferase family 4 protein n=1 Tax=Adlercreutzia shanghongiae TaxID=3111773 RepID=UPI002DBAB636|nr:glycosyltransferase family 4 protein [Adlercreutzia sp. R25]MEC4273868.1 glycosyltransferase family 4 protein [Adlercreutzia sp. R25]
MKILMVCQRYWPEHFQVTEVCEELASRGHEVTALVGLPNYPTGVIPAEYLDGKNRLQVRNSVKIIRCEEVPRSRGVLGLAKNYISYVVSACSKVKELTPDYDLVFSYQLSPVLMAVPAVSASKKMRLPLVLYCADIWPDAVRAMLPKPLSFLMPLLRRMSARIYRSCSAIAVNSSEYIHGFSEMFGIGEDRLVYIPQYADDEYLINDFNKNTNDKVRFAMIGNIGKLQHMQTLMQAIRKLGNRGDYEVHIVGTGSALDYCKEFIQANGLSSTVFFHGRRPYEEMPDYYKMADACLLTLHVPDAPWISATLPSRLQGYMAAGKPVIAAIDGSAKEVIEDSGCGLAVPATDSSALADVMQLFIEDKTRFEKCGYNGRVYFKKHFMKQRHMDNIEELLIKVGAKTEGSM